jgi:hypothetical protein
VNTAAPAGACDAARAGLVGSAAGADVARAGDVDAAVGWAAGDSGVVALGLVEAVDIGVAAAVVAVVGELWPVGAAPPQPAAIPIMREAPAITRIPPCAPRSNRMLPPIRHHPCVAPGRLANRTQDDRQFGLVRPVRLRL